MILVLSRLKRKPILQHELLHIFELEANRSARFTFSKSIFFQKSAFY